jgi:D-alanyl-D-alanine carboxypeptidase (penicillin-binding protein 5/6)
MLTRRQAGLRALLVLVLLASALKLPGAAAEGRGGPDVTCAACIAVAGNGRILWARSPDARRANASTTKMVTALVAVGAADIEDEVAVSPTAAATGGGGLDLQEGDAFSVEELLYALLLSSSNDAAVALAEHVSGTEAAFVRIMNRRAQRMGAENTRFVTAHGLDAFGHFSTARDLSLIGRRLLQKPALARIVQTPRTVITGGGEGFELENRNPLLETYSGAVGIKTGYTAEAGNVLVGAAQRNGRTVVAVAMGSADATADTRALLDYGFARLARQTLVRAGEIVGALYGPGGGSTTVRSGQTVRGPYEPGSVEIELRPPPSGGAISGEVVGEVIVRARGRRIAVVDAVATDTVTIHGRPWPADVAAWILRTAATTVGRL